MLSSRKAYGSIFPDTLRLISLLKNEVLVLNLIGYKLKESARKL